MDVAALANADVSIFFDGCPILKSDGAGDGDLIIADCDADGAVDRRADSKGFTDDSV